MFENTLAHVEDCGLTFLHVFPYSAREGTPASRMPQLPMPLRKERAQRLRQAGQNLQEARFRSWIGNRAKILIEKPTDNGEWFGHTEGFAPVHLAGAAKPGEIVTATITAVCNGKLSGVIDHV